MSTKRLIIVDVSSFIFRAFYAIRVLHSPEGVPVNAVHGVLNMLMKLFSKYRPTHVLIAKDTSGGSFRNELYSEYKANRSAPPEELIPQFALIKQLIDHMECPYSLHDNYEADDIIGSACVQWKDKFDEILIASGDKDLMQFVDGNIKMLDTMKEKIFGPDEVFEKMGVRPDQIVDYLSMVGDTSDNIPGMKGIGAKGAAKLLAEHGTLEKCIEVKDTFKGKKLTTAFSEHLDDAILSKKLVQIVTDVELGIDPEKTEFTFYPSDELINYLKELGFKTAPKKLEDIRYQVAQAEANGEEGITDLSAAKPVASFEHTLVDNDEKYNSCLKAIEENDLVAIHTEFNGNNVHQRDIIGLSISTDEKGAFYLPFYGDKSLGEEKLKEVLAKTWSSEKELASSHMKDDMAQARKLEIEFNAKTFDVAQAHYIFKTSGKHTIEFMSEEYLGHTLEAADKKAPYLSDMEEEKAFSYTADRGVCTLQLANSLKKDLASLELDKIYADLDDKVARVLSNMEYEGIVLNPAYLKELEEEFSKQLEEIQSKVDKHSKEPVNLNSPKQVGAFLFEELELPVVKKTKTGYSTDSEVLEELDSKGVSEVPGLILKYRELGKILSTYVKALPELINEKTGRVHTHFNQNVAATGRLSSTNPNLQNIPIRSENGRRVRKGFIASPGKLLLAADYSQVELRLLAHFSEDPTMLKAFNNGVDIHAQTASEVMSIPLEEVHANERSKAKAVNFGLMYGQSSFGLAKALKISRKEAKEYITSYFVRFNKVKSFLDTLKEEATETGYAITMHGRKRMLPDIHSSNRTVKANAERVAINSPIQGTAADIIKLAMIKIDEMMKEKSLKSKMLLQVHDELIFEVPEEELEVMKELVKTGMENVVDLKVPLTVDMGIGVNWYDLK